MALVSGAGGTEISNQISASTSQFWHLTMQLNGDILVNLHQDWPNFKYGGDVLIIWPFSNIPIIALKIGLFISNEGS